MELNKSGDYVSRRKCGLFTNIAPLYTRPFWDELVESDKVSYFFYSSKRGFSGIKTIDPNESKEINEKGKFNWFFLRNIYLGRVLIYQIGMITRFLMTDYEAYILNGEMYSISNWISILICKFRKKPVLLWGHGIYGNEKYLKRIIRLLFCRIADYHLVYGKSAGNLMISEGINQNRIFPVYNSLDFKTHMRIYETKNLEETKKLKIRLFQKNSGLPVVIFIGRLTKEKKISLLIEAIYQSRKKGHLYNCLIVGEGSEINNLKDLTNRLAISEQVLFYGACYDENTNSSLIMLADCCVSPGNVGLTAIHCMSLGTPVITHMNMCHQMPEAEAIIPGETGLFFEEDNIKSLSDCIDELILNQKKLFMEPNCIRMIREYWNPIKQKELFDEAVLRSISGKMSIDN